MAHGSTKETIMLILIVLVFVKLFFPKLLAGVSRFKMADINTTGTGKDPNMFWALKNDLDCVAGGAGPNADYYARSDKSGGVCGGQQFVNDQMRKWQYAEGANSL
jgi:hypothetical protein